MTYIFGIIVIIDTCLKIKNISKLESYYYHCVPQIDVDDYIGNCRQLLWELYELYTIVYNPNCNMCRRLALFTSH